MAALPPELLYARVDLARRIRLLGVRVGALQRATADLAAVTGPRL